MVSLIVSELAVQKRTNEDEMQLIFEHIKRKYRTHTQLHHLEYEHTHSIEQRRLNVLETRVQIFREKPEALAEYNSIIKKHTQTSKKGGKS